MPTQSEIARAWQTSRNYIHKCVRKRGCPTQSYAAAAEWRDTYARQRPPTDVKQLQLQHEDNSHLKAVVHGRKSFQGVSAQSRLLSDPLEFAVKAARWTEERVSILLRAAIEEGRDSKVVPLLMAYNEALQGRLKIEKLCRAEIQRLQDLIPIKTAGALAAKGLNVMVTRILELPKKSGALLNPQNPAQATALLDTECKNIILDARKGYPQEISEAVRWPNNS
jgi:hypothetical protein